MNNIFVLGTRRSGTTFLGKLLYASLSGFSYIEEPFNPVAGFKTLPHVWYPYNSMYTGHYKKELDNLENLKPVKFKRSIVNDKTKASILNATLWQSVKEVFLNLSKESLTRRILRVFVKNKHNFSYHKAILLERHKDNIIKDPLISLSINDLVLKDKNKVVFIYRDPVAFYHSIKRLNWAISTKNFTNQSDLVKDWDFIKTLPKNNKIDNIINEWIIVNTIALESLKKNKSNNLVCLSHTKLSKYPTLQTQKLVQKFQLKDKLNSKKIEQLTQTNRTTDESNNTKDIRRNSIQQLNKWKGHLEEDDVKYIRQRTGELLKELDKYAI